jgi:polysaccharide export outer membrane protein
MQRHRALKFALPLGASGVLALTLLTGCAPGLDVPPVPPYQPGVYKLGVGDQLRVITFGEEQLTDDFRVSENGTIAFPLLGNERAAGMTTSELATKLAKELQDHQLLKDPSVSVEVTAYRPISVLGEVARPGEYPFRPGMTMLTAVAIAGGFTYRAVQDYSLAVRQSDGKTVEGKLTPQDYVAPGDVIKIYERLF